MTQSNESKQNQFHSLPPGASKSLVRFARFARFPIERFQQIEAASGILLLVAAAIALILANSPIGESYQNFWKIPVGVRIGSLAFERSLEWIINDGLMAIFFFVVGLEIRREVHSGELSSVRKAALPFFAAMGGMIIPAAFFIMVAGSPETRSGWGVPMATDIAFAVGILTILGKRVPKPLRVLLLSVAVIDDLGAILIIAFFYSSGIAISGLAVAATGFVAVLLMQRFGVRSKLIYVLPAVIAWAGIYVAGVHPTIAGVIVGLMTPVQAWLGPGGSQESIAKDLRQLSAESQQSVSIHQLSGTLRHIDFARREALSPAESLIDKLHPWVAFVIMPIFALANAGVVISDISLQGNLGSVVLGVVFGLVLGKPLGIVLFSWLALRTRLATFPTGISFRHLTVLGMVAGVGFTMALFIAQLAFNDESLLSSAKFGVLIASGIAAVFGLLLGWILFSKSLLQNHDGDVC